MRGRLHFMQFVEGTRPLWMIEENLVCIFVSCQPLLKWIIVFVGRILMVGE